GGELAREDQNEVLRAFHGLRRPYIGAPGSRLERGISSAPAKPMKAPGELAEGTCAGRSDGCGVDLYRFGGCPAGPALGRELGAADQLRRRRRHRQVRRRRRIVVRPQLQGANLTEERWT